VKVYISADIEGMAGITSPDEANPEHRDIAYFKDQMTREVRGACEGAMASGAHEIWVKDAHWTGRNIDPRALPECVRMVRGWSGHPYSMMQELDGSFAAALFIGYHARAGSGGNPLAHTMSGRVVNEMRINDEPASEFLLNTYTATSVGVPVAFLSGDEDLCAEVRRYNEAIQTYATMRGVGQSTVSVHPEVAVKGIRDGVREALDGRDLKKTRRPLPERFVVELDYKLPREAYGRSFFPGARLVRDATLRFETTEWFEVLRMFMFCIK
jgi:D-amino peptidase